MTDAPGDISPGLLAALRREGLDRVDGAFAYGEGQDLAKPGLGVRRRTRLAIDDEDGRTHVLYLKRYGAGSVAAALRRWARHGRAASPARTEFENILAARAAGVPTMRPVYCGEDPCPLGAKRSYLIVTAVPGDALERCFAGYLAENGETERVEAVTLGLARLVRTLHDAGYVHRDLYASHVFLDAAADPPALHLIDLARMFRLGMRRRRWYVKDLAQLKYSMPAPWVRRYWEVFLHEYFPGVSRDAARRFDRLIDGKVAAIRRHARPKGRRAAGEGQA